MSFFNLSFFNLPSIRIHLGLLFCSASAWLVDCPEGHCMAAEPPAATARLGINLAGPADWNTELPFVDVFRLSRRWISQREGAGWGKGPTLELDQQGWVKQLAPNCWAETLLCTIEGGHYPSGDYTVLYDGDGRIELAGAATEVIWRKPGRMVVRVDASRGAIFLRLRETSPVNPVHNIQVLMPGFATVAVRDHPWHPAFLRRWQGMAVIRFMDFMKTNNSRIHVWSDRPRPDDATWTTRGMPAELLIDLANRLEADPWLCIPHAADDDFVRRLATLVQGRLDPKRIVYLEYSNEVWNRIFAQHRYAAEQGQRLGLADKPWEAAWRFTASRSVEIFRIWEDVFGDAKRFVRVLPTQAANPYVSEQVLKFQNAYRHADALAIAPYISLNLRPGGEPGAEEVQDWTTDQVLDRLEKKSLPEAVAAIERQKVLADRFGLRLIAYEAGQHAVGVAGGENNEKLTRLLHAVNVHPRMGALYTAYYNRWQETGGDLMCVFSSVSRWSKWGSWGILQYADEAPRDAPKFMATMKWAKANGQPVAWDDTNQNHNKP